VKVFIEQRYEKCSAFRVAGYGILSVNRFAFNNNFEETLQDEKVLLLSIHISGLPAGAEKTCVNRSEPGGNDYFTDAGRLP
jgi:hypothetical protein